METHRRAPSSFSSPLPFILIFLSISSPVLLCASANVGVDSSEPLRTYIVRVQLPADVAAAGAKAVESWYASFLSESTSGAGESRLVHSYSEVFVGFAAKLTKAELNSIRRKEGFVRAFPNRNLRLQTTHTPAFLGLQPDGGLWKDSSLGRGVIIGLLDTGIAPTHPSFSDDGVPPPPAKWKGSCDFKAGCNNKLIGARSFVQGDEIPSDEIGHGTHTAGTAAGNFVQGAEVYGQAGGTAAGLAPHAHVALYKVCSKLGCFNADVLAGLDAAVKDGVDVLSISLGGDSVPLYKDLIAIGAFAAISKGIFVSCAAGNRGPATLKLSNEAPWYITVGAASVDRSFRSYVRLTNGGVYEGESLNQFDNFSSEAFPLAYSSVGTPCDDFQEFNITGKIVVCEPQGDVPSLSITQYVREAGGVGIVYINSEEVGYTALAGSFDLPTSQLSYADSAGVITYAATQDNPTASIVFNGTVLGTSPAPVIAFFSSRGPNKQVPLILKPDVSAPGVNILAAWPNQGDRGNDGEKTFNIESGTSMATPHVSGIAALIKSVHPDWSAAAVKSAIITTSDDSGRDGKPILNHLYRKANFFTAGAGYVNPSKAADPGLIYDISIDDYIGFICNVYGDEGARTIVGNSSVSCSKVEQKSEEQLNLPSMVATPGSEPWTITRTVTNVGIAKSTYTAQVDVPEDVTVKVTPPTLSFTAVGEKKTFNVSIGWTGRPNGILDGNLKWVSDRHVVRSPIVVGVASSS